MVSNATPQKKQILGEKGIQSESQNAVEVLKIVKKTCQALGKIQKRVFTSRLARSLEDSRYGLKRYTSSSLGFTQKYFNRYSKRSRLNINEEAPATRADATSDHVRTLVMEHFEKPDISIEMPNIKAVGKEGTAKHVLQKTLHRTYDAFQEENADVQLPFSKFVDLRPKNILLQIKAKHFQCLCEYCTNIDLKIKAINSAVIQNKLQCTLPDRYFAANLTMCNVAARGYRPLTCVDREC